MKPTKLERQQVRIRTVAATEKLVAILERIAGSLDVYLNRPIVCDGCAKRVSRK